MIKTRKKVRMLTFAIATVVVLCATTVVGYTRAARYKTYLDYSYTRALSDLTDCVDSIELTLNKSVYANTPTQQTGLSGKLMRETAMAKAALSVLPITDATISSVGRYITQVGDFAMTLSGKVSAGQGISEKERAVIDDLEQYAASLKNSMGAVKPDFEGDSLTRGMKKTAEDFVSFPSMIYDGPFSDHIAQQTPRLLAGMGQILQGNAQAMAAEFLGEKTRGLQHTQDSAGNLPTYNFMAEDARISITKYGGLIVSVMREREITAQKLDFPAAKEKALAFLKERGVTSLKETYYVINDGLCTINFAYFKDDILYYPDLVKIGVALDNGEIMEYNAAGYIMNHTVRTLTAPKVTLSEAQKKLSPRLKIETAALTLIPTPGLSEVLCWEFLCTGTTKNGATEKVLVYINTQTGFEEQILIMTQSDGGVFAK